MKKRKILTALAIAYRNGVISKESIGRWNKANKVITHSLKFMLPLAVIVGLIFHVNLNQVDDSIRTVYVIQQTVVNIYQIQSIFLVIIGMFFLYKLLNYLIEVVYFQSALQQTQAMDYKITALSSGEAKIQIK